MDTFQVGEKVLITWSWGDPHYIGYIKGKSVAGALIKRDGIFGGQELTTWDKIQKYTE